MWAMGSDPAPLSYSLYKKKSSHPFVKCCNKKNTSLKCRIVSNTLFTHWLSPAFILISLYLLFFFFCLVFFFRQYLCGNFFGWGLQDICPNLVRIPAQLGDVLRLIFQFFWMSVVDVHPILVPYSTNDASNNPRLFHCISVRHQTKSLIWVSDFDQIFWTSSIHLFADSLWKKKKPFSLFKDDVSGFRRYWAHILIS